MSKDREKTWWRDSYLVLKLYYPDFDRDVEWCMDWDGACPVFEKYRDALNCADGRRKLIYPISFRPDEVQ